MGGTGVPPVVSGVAPETEVARSVIALGRSLALPAFRRGAGTNRPEALFHPRSASTRVPLLHPAQYLKGGLRGGGAEDVVVGIEDELGFAQGGAVFPEPAEGQRPGDDRIGQSAQDIERQFELADLFARVMVADELETLPDGLPVGQSPPGRKLPCAHHGFRRIAVTKPRAGAIERQDQAELQGRQDAPGSVEEAYRRHDRVTRKPASQNDALNPESAGRADLPVSRGGPHPVVTQHGPNYLGTKGLPQQPAFRDFIFAQGRENRPCVIFQRPFQSPWVGDLDQPNLARQRFPHPAHEGPIRMDTGQIHQRRQRRVAVDSALELFGFRCGVQFDA